LSALDLRRTERLFELAIERHDAHAPLVITTPLDLLRAD
jgi:hypothetical protein